MSGGAGCSLWRVIRPQSRYRPYRSEKDDERSRLLSKIEALYREACDRLVVKAGPVTLARFLDTGFCVGLLDPVSNIMINTVATSVLRPDFRAKVLTFTGAVVEEKLAEMGRRSLDGLVAFLIYFFPYLVGWEALRYLLVADADLLVAARLIVADRGMMMFSLTSPASAPAFEAALRLAAQVAKHPQPNRLVHVWMSLSSRLHKVLMVLQPDSPRSNLHHLNRFLDEPVVPYLGQSWDLAASRLPYKSITSMPYQHTRSLRMVLLDTIRGFYLRALARLPRHELRSRYHRSLLKAGHCYGPMDPISNIILNTIWYDVTFPTAVQPVLDVIGPNSLTRLESRSFYGLVSFLQTRYHNLSEHEVVQCLVASCAYLSFADPNLDAAAAGEEEQQRHQRRRDDLLNLRRFITPGLYDAVRKVEQQSPCSSAQEAYEAAATAAWHPNPEAQGVFLSSWKAMLQGCALPLLQNGDQLTSENVQYIASLLSPKQQPTPERIKKSSYYPVRAGKMRSEAQQRRISRKVKAALDRHLLRDGEPMYDLHIICCVNEDVCGPEYCDDADDDLSFAPCKYHYSHVNFLVTQKGSQYADRYPILFFAEFDNEEEGAPLLCCRVDEPTSFAEHVRCLYCEAEGAKVVHPALEKFHGGDREFEEVIRGESSLTNDVLICKNEDAVQHMCALLPLIRDTLGLTATDIGNAGVASVSGAVFARVAMGTACDLAGPRLASASLILLTTPAVYCSSIIQSASSYLLVRFFTGFSLASFVSTQFWMSSMFSPPKVGLANGVAGGWGNLGGGAVQLLMPLVYDAILRIGSTPFTAWRVAFFIPGVMQTFSAIAVLAFGQDMPDGNYRKLHKTGEKHKDNFGSVLHHAVTNYRGWILALTYGYCFGVELAVDNIIAQYFYDRFGVNLRTAGFIAASFGMANIISRPGGGLLSDWLSSRFGMRGRLWGLWVVQTIGGVLCVVLGIVDYSFGASVAVMILFSFFVQAACGLTFGIVPFVSCRSLGLISGMTGAGGNVGAVLTQLIFFHGTKYKTETGIMYMGIMIIACTLPTTLIHFPQWGGMFVGPRPGATAEEYYSREWTAHEREKGFNAATVRFAENSVREGGRRSASGSQSKHTVPVEESPAGV